MTSKNLSIFIFFIACYLLSGCEINETIGNLDSEFEVSDINSNPLIIKIKARYAFKENELIKKDTRYKYNDDHTLKLLSIIASEISKKHTASDIYSYKRTKIKNSIKTKFENTLNQSNIEVLDFYFASVMLSDSLRNELIKKHIEKTKK